MSSAGREAGLVSYVLALAGIGAGCYNSERYETPFNDLGSGGDCSVRHCDSHDLRVMVRRTRRPRSDHLGLAGFVMAVIRRNSAKDKP